MSTETLLGSLVAPSVQCALSVALDTIDLYLAILPTVDLQHDYSDDTITAVPTVVCRKRAA